MTLLGLPFLLTLLLATPAYWALPKPWRLPLAGAAGLACLAWFAPVSAAFCLAVAACCHALARRGVRSGTAYGAAAAMFVSLLALREILARLGASQSVVPWLGAAFFTLRAASYVISCAQGQAMAASLRDCLCYLFFAPTLVIGPVQRYADFEREARRNRFDAQRLSAGMERILFGYAKVVLLADFLIEAKLAGHVDAMPPGPLHAYLDCLDYGLALYFKFAGYSDVAIGFALMLGIRVPENFDFPFLALNIADFWRRWHASVSAWCRDNVSFPLYARTRSIALSTLAAMLVLGLWHECSPRYLAWGAYHGAGIVAWQRWRALVAFAGWRPAPAWAWPGRVLAWAVTFNFVVLGFAITRAHDLAQAARTFVQLAGR